MLILQRDTTRAVRFTECRLLNVDYAKTVVINKRSMNVGYAGIENELFFYPNALMYFGDSKEAMSKLVSEIKAL